MDNNLTDSFGRQITYLRLSVTDRCDLRCTYCMAENMTFLPRKDLLTLEELDELCTSFITRGIRKIRLTGGEPLVRRGVMSLIKGLSRHRESGALDEITMTTNGTQLANFADELKACGVERINVSLDSRDPETFLRLTRRAALDDVMRGIDAAQEAGLNVKINTVALKGTNDAEIPDLMKWAHGRGMDMTLIEVMPLGEIDEDRVDQYIPLTAVRESLEGQFTLIDTPLKTGGPARYVKVAETGGLLGMITPLTNNFCAGCNRVRVTCTGQIYTCLGHGGKLDLREAIRGDNPKEQLDALLNLAMHQKPEKHNFDISDRGAAPAVARHMSVTGG
ncbi:GTP 3',8-cyclase MoaA [Hellea sp.]|nr:GTP 3',8-cyclase MoaA [Hellea sp.]